MRQIFLIIGLTLSLNIIAQKNNLYTQTIKDIQQIDSLFRQLKSFYFAELSIDYKEHKLKLIHETHRDAKQIYDDTLITTVPIDSIAIREYCNKTRADFNIIYPLLYLMTKNKFISLYTVGPGDCSDCSTQIAFEKTKRTTSAFICKDLKSRCMPYDCYDDITYVKWKKDFKEAHSKKLTDRILLVRRRHDYYPD